jgi:uncharacterized lipoprotein
MQNSGQWEYLKSTLCLVSPIQSAQKQRELAIVVVQQGNRKNILVNAQIGNAVTQHQTHNIMCVLNVVVMHQEGAGS